VERQPEDPGSRLTARVAARAAHELNNSLAIFSGHIFLLRDAAEPLDDALDAMEKAVENALRLARNLAELGSLGIDEPEFLDVGETLRGALSDVPPERIDLDVASGLPPVLARRSDVARAVRALVQNAREALEGAGIGAPVRVAATNTAGEVRVAIEDSGPGVADVVRRRDFDPLFTTKGERGRGLGVTLARSAALLGGGSLTIEERPGGGTRAVIRLLRQ
jgi:signal transduction histidine kinase